MIKPAIASICVAAALGIAIAGKPSTAKAQAGTCMADFNNDFGAYQSSHPLDSGWGSKATYQWSYFLGENGLNILMKYQSCMDASDFAANFEALSSMRDKGREGCLALTTDAGSCTPTYPPQ